MVEMSDSIMSAFDSKGKAKCILSINNRLMIG